MKTIYLILLFGLTFITFSCKDRNPNNQIDEGNVEGNVYFSDDIGWTIEIPDGWAVTSREENDKFVEKGKEAFEENLNEEIDISSLKNLIGFQKNKFNSFQSTTEPFIVEYDGEWEENNQALKSMLYEIYTERGIKVDSTETTTDEVDGLDFNTYELIIYSPEGEIILNQLIYDRLINNYDFGIAINYNNEEDKKTMLNAWLNSKFKNIK